MKKEDQFELGYKTAKISENKTLCKIILFLHKHKVSHLSELAFLFRVNKATLNSYLERLNHNFGFIKEINVNDPDGLCYVQSLAGSGSRIPRRSLRMFKLKTLPTEILEKLRSTLTKAELEELENHIKSATVGSKARSKQIEKIKNDPLFQESLNLVKEKPMLLEGRCRLIQNKLGVRITPKELKQFAMVGSAE